MNSYYDKYPVQLPHSRSPRVYWLLLLWSALTVVGVVFIASMIFGASTIDRGDGRVGYECAAVITSPTSSDYRQESDRENIVCGQQRTRRMAMAGLAALGTLGCAGLARRSVRDLDTDV